MSTRSTRIWHMLQTHNILQYPVLHEALYILFCTGLSAHEYDYIEYQKNCTLKNATYNYINKWINNFKIWINDINEWMNNRQIKITTCKHTYKKHISQSAKQFLPNTHHEIRNSSGFSNKEYLVWWSLTSCSCQRYILNLYRSRWDRTRRPWEAVTDSR